MHLLWGRSEKKLGIDRRWADLFPPSTFIALASSELPQETIQTRTTTAFQSPVPSDDRFLESGRTLVSQDRTLMRLDHGLGVDCPRDLGTHPARCSSGAQRYLAGSVCVLPILLEH